MAHSNAHLHLFVRLTVALAGGVALFAGGCAAPAESGTKPAATPPPEPASATLPPAPATTQLASGLQAELNEYELRSRSALPPERLAAIDKGIAELQAANVGAHVPHVGERAPEFTLQNTASEPVALAELLKTGPVVLLWYRGAWCPYCTLTLRAYEDAYDDIQGLGASLVAISPQTLENSATTKELAQLDFPVLSDPGNRVARMYGLAHAVPPALLDEAHVRLSQYNGDATHELPLAATIVIARDGVIRYVFADPDYRKRGEPAAVLDTLRKLKAGQ